MTERVSILTDIHRTAKHEHVCNECRRKIMPGENYRYESFAHEDRIYSHKTCRHCESVRDYVCKNSFDGGFGYGNLYEDLQDICDDSLYTRLMESGMRRKWMRKDGKMWRVIS